MLGQQVEAAADNRSHSRRVNIQDDIAILNRAIASLRNINTHLKVQVLGNIDNALFGIGKEASLDDEMQDNLAYLADHLIKSSIKRQVSRISGVCTALESFLQEYHVKQTKHSQVSN